MGSEEWALTDRGGPGRLAGAGRRGRRLPLQRGHPLRRLAQGAVEVELGGVVFADGGGVLLVGGLHRGDRLDDFLGPDDQAEQLAGGPGRLAQADEVLVGRLDRLEHALLGLDHADPGGLEPGEGLRDLGLDPVDRPGELDRGQVALGAALADQPDVADAAVLELPDGGELDVHARAVAVQRPVGAGGEVAGRELAGGRRRAEDEQVGQERAALLAAEELLGRGDQLAPGGDLGPVVHGDPHQGLGLLVAGHQRDLQERRLDRLQQRGRVEQQDLRELGAGDPPVADGDLLSLPQLWSSVWARLISSGAIRLGARPRVKFTSISARTIDASMPSSRPRAAWRLKKAAGDLEAARRSAPPGGRPPATPPPAAPPAA